MTNQSVIKINPVPKPRMVRSDAWKNRTCVTKYWSFKHDLVHKAELMGLQIGDVLSVRFVIPMPKSWSKKKKHRMLHKPHQQRPDLDNLIKAIQDCLLQEDSNVWYYRDVCKIWGTEGEIIFYDIKKILTTK